MESSPATLILLIVAAVAVVAAAWALWGGRRGNDAEIESWGAAHLEPGAFPIEDGGEQSSDPYWWSTTDDDDASIDATNPAHSEPVPEDSHGAFGWSDPTDLTAGGATQAEFAAPGDEQFDATAVEDAIPDGHDVNDVGPGDQSAELSPFAWPETADAERTEPVAWDTSEVSGQGEVAWPATWDNESDVADTVMSAEDGGDERRDRMRWFRRRSSGPTGDAELDLEADAVGGEQIDELDPSAQLADSGGVDEPAHVEDPAPLAWSETIAAQLSEPDSRDTFEVSHQSEVAWPAARGVAAEAEDNPIAAESDERNDAGDWGGSITTMGADVPEPQEPRRWFRWKKADRADGEGAAHDDLVGDDPSGPDHDTTAEPPVDSVAVPELIAEAPEAAVDEQKEAFGVEEFPEEVDTNPWEATGEGWSSWTDPAAVGVTANDEPEVAVGDAGFADLGDDELLGDVFDAFPLGEPSPAPVTPRTEADTDTSPEWLARHDDEDDAFDVLFPSVESEEFWETEPPRRERRAAVRAARRQERADRRAARAQERAARRAERSGDDNATEPSDVAAGGHELAGDMRTSSESGPSPDEWADPFAGAEQNADDTFLSDAGADAEGESDAGSRIDNDDPTVGDVEESAAPRARRSWWPRRGRKTDGVGAAAAEAVVSPVVDDVVPVGAVDGAVDSTVSWGEPDMETGPTQGDLPVWVEPSAPAPDWVEPTAAVPEWTDPHDKAAAWVDNPIVVIDDRVEDAGHVQDLDAPVEDTGGFLDGTVDFEGIAEATGVPDGNGVDATVEPETAVIDDRREDTVESDPATVGPVAPTRAERRAAKAADRAAQKTAKRAERDERRQRRSQEREATRIQKERDRQSAALDEDVKAAQKEAEAQNRRAAADAKAIEKQRQADDRAFLKAQKQLARSSRSEDKALARRQKAAEREVARAQRRIAREEGRATRAALAERKATEREQRKLMRRGGAAETAAIEPTLASEDVAVAAYSWEIEAGAMAGDASPDMIDHRAFGLPEPLPVRR